MGFWRSRNLFSSIERTDSAAEVDMNVIMTESGQFVEIQGTGEEATYSHAQLLEMLDVASQGIQQLIAMQKQIS